MTRHLRFIILGVLLGYATPTLAQSFQGLDLGSSSSSKKRHRGKGKKRKGSKKASADEEEEAPAAPASPASPAPSASSGGSDLQMPPPPAGTSQKPSAPPPSNTGADSGGLGLDLTGGNSAPAPRKAGKKDNTPAMTFEAVDVSGKTGDRQRLDAAINLFKDKQYEQAALSAYELINDPKFAELQTEANYLLAKSLYRIGMYHSSLIEFSKVLSKGPNTKYFKPSLEWLFYISHKTTNESVILDEIAKYSNFEFPEKFRNEFRYLLARYYFVRGRALDRAEQKQEADSSFEKVKEITLQVPRGDPFYARAKYLEGLAYFREGNPNAALQDMKDVVRLTRASGDKTPQQRKSDEDLRELAFMQLARTHYGAKQNRYAIYYFSKVERGNEQWLEALFESSWANYRIGQYEQALGNLITLSSPFFRDEYFPEALILKAVIYYENCRYRESTAIVHDFERTYDPVRKELESLIDKNLDASEYYNVLSDVQKRTKANQSTSSTEIILERVLKLALADKDLKQVNDSILELESELDSYGNKSDTFKYSNLAKAEMEALKQQRATLVKKAGIMAKGQMEVQLGELRRLLGDGERIKFETTTKEKEFLEESLKTGAATEIVRKYKYSVAVADDQLYWPYEGEYWRDELGTYQYTLTKGCRDRETANRNASGE